MVDGAEQEKDKVVGLFNHMALFNCMNLAALTIQLPSIIPRESLFIDANPTTFHGFAPRLHLVSRYWNGLTNFTVALMDVFGIILGLEF